MYPTNDREIQKFGKLKTEVEHYFYYSELLQKKRTEKARKRVEEVIKNIPNILARINEIEKIDEQDKKDHPDFYKDTHELKKRVKPAISYEKYQIEKASEREIEKPLKELKSSGFFAFIFHERGNLRRFAADSQMLDSKFFGFIFKLSNHFFSSMEDLNKEIDFNVIESLRFILEIGWTTLKKKQYNTLYCFYNFINEFINFASQVKSNANVNYLLEALDSVMPFYLQLLNKDKHKDIIIEAIQLTLSVHSKHKDAIASIIDIVLRVFSIKETGKVNFFQIIIAVFNLAYKKKIEIEDLFDHYVVDDIPDRIFVCDNKVEKKIEERIDKVESEIESVEKELFVVKSVNENLSLNDLGKNGDFKKLSYRIMKASGKFDKFKSDNIDISDYLEDDLLYAIQLYIIGFDTLFGKVLNGEIIVKNQGEEKRTRIFEVNVFKEHLGDLKNSLREISDFRSLNPHINITSQIYQHFIKSRHLDIEKDEKACNIIFITARAFYKIFMQLLRPLYDHYYLMKNGIEDPITMQEIMKKPLMEVEEELRVIPFYYYKVISDKFEERSVLEILDDIAFFCANLAYIFDIEEIVHAVQAKDFLLSKSDSLLKERAKYV